jgi:DNA primase
MADFDRQKRRAKGTAIEAELLRRGVRLSGRGKERFGPCPKCGGTDRFSINTEKLVFNCRQCGGAGDVIELVRFLDGCGFNVAVETLAGESTRKVRRKTKGDGAAADTVAPPIPDFKHPQAVFDYADADGNLLYQNVRFPRITVEGSPVISSKGKLDKTFRLRRPNGTGLGDTAQIPYRLPDLIKAFGDGATVFIPEGEAKVDSLLKWGVPATWVATGTKDYAELFRGADIVLMPDNDDEGWNHANRIGAALHGAARRIRVLMLPGLPDKGDVIDWIAAGGTAEKLRELAETAPAWMPHAAASLPEDTEKIDELARLTAIQYDRERKRAAKALY